MTDQNEHDTKPEATGHPEQYDHPETICAGTCVPDAEGDLRHVGVPMWHQLELEPTTCVWAGVQRWDDVTSGRQQPGEPFVHVKSSNPAGMEMGLDEARGWFRRVADELDATAEKLAQDAPAPQRQGTWSRKVNAPARRRHFR